MLYTYIQSGNNVTINGNTVVHTGNISSQTVNYANSTGSVSWSNVTGKPSTFTPSGHTHDYLPLSGGTINGNLNSTGGGLAGFICLELNSTGALGGYGGFIDFHYNGSSGDYTTRIIEQGNGMLQIIGSLAVTGDVYCSNVHSSSDARIKKNIQSIDRHGLSDLFAVSDKLLKQFDWKQSGKTSYGFIAQELEKYIPEAVDTNDDEKTVSYNVAYAKIMASLVNEIKKLKAEVRSLKQHN